jgi:hypothetical protein
MINSSFTHRLTLINNSPERVILNEACLSQLVSELERIATGKSVLTMKENHHRTRTEMLRTSELDSGKQHCRSDVRQCSRSHLSISQPIPSYSTLLSVYHLLSLPYIEIAFITFAEESNDDGTLDQAGYNRAMYELISNTSSSNVLDIERVVNELWDNRPRPLDCPNPLDFPGDYCEMMCYLSPLFYGSSLDRLTCCFSLFAVVPETFPPLDPEESSGVETAMKDGLISRDNAYCYIRTVFELLHNWVDIDPLIRASDIMEGSPDVMSFTTFLRLVVPRGQLEQPLHRNSVTLF